MEPAHSAHRCKPPPISRRLHPQTLQPSTGNEMINIHVFNTGTSYLRDQS